MKTNTLMRKIFESDIELSQLEHREDYDFYIDLGLHAERHGKYNRLYYIKCEEQGLTLEEAKEQLGEFLREQYGYKKKEE